jgi:hypothetical protein
MNAAVATTSSTATSTTTLDTNDIDSTEPGMTSPLQVLKLLQPFITEQDVRDINTVYEFHIKVVRNGDRNEEEIKIYHLDLKNFPKGLIGPGVSQHCRADCVIKMNHSDLDELLTDKLKPFSAYMAGRIEIDGNLQDVFRLKKLIKTVTSVMNNTNAVNAMR